MLLGIHFFKKKLLILEEQRERFLKNFNISERFTFGADFGQGDFEIQDQWERAVELSKYPS